MCVIFMSSILYTAHAETESKTCKERGMEFSTDEYNARGYELIHMLPYENHTKDIKLTLCWIVDDQIQVGKLITLDAKASSERYTMNNNNHAITITFPNEIINYWEDSNHTRQFNYTTSNQLILTQNNFGIFESEPINFRFTLPESISITYCEYFPNEECIKVNNLLQPSSYYLDQEIELAKQTAKLANDTLVLTEEILVLNKEIKDLTYNMVILTISLVIIPAVGMLNNWKLEVERKTLVIIPAVGMLNNWKLEVERKTLIKIAVLAWMVCIPLIYFVINVL